MEASRWRGTKSACGSFGHQTAGEATFNIGSWSLHGRHPKDSIRPTQLGLTSLVAAHRRWETFVGTLLARLCPPTIV
jgi:hypothetical protein